jgi:hypothetical protein
MDETKTSWTDRRAAARASWEQLIGEFEGSGKTGTAFCRDRGLSIWQFRYWLKALRQAEAEPTGFVELSSGARDPGVWVACGRWRVHVSNGFDTGVLRRVVEALT